jgi:predicted O-methyltransferase YrrM
MHLGGQGPFRCGELSELIPADESCRAVVDYRQGHGIRVDIKEFACLSAITRVCRPSAIFEIGTFRGLTTLHFALNSPASCKVYTLDLPHDERATFASTTNATDASIIAQSKTGVEFKEEEVACKITQLFGNSLSFDFLPYAESMDIVFVDGAHHYEAALSDTRNAFRMLKPGGWLIWHDFANYGDYNDVMRAAFAVIPAKEVFLIENTQLAVYKKALSSEVFDLKPTSPPARSSYDGAIIGIQTL